MHLRILTTAALSSLALLAAGVTAPAQAAGAPFDLWSGTQISGGLPSDLPGDTHCTVNDARDIDVAAGCFKEYGDRFYVRDTNGDGRSAMVYYEVDGKNGACLNTNGQGTTAVCDLSSQIPENKQVCIWTGNIEMAQSSPDRFKYYLESRSRVCFTNNN